jgi:threonine synthase
MKSGTRLNRLFVQVGGGALASSVIQAFDDARRLGVPVATPAVHPVQTHGAYPLTRAYERLYTRLTSGASPAAVDNALRYAATHRSEFMWPWETEPRSIAHGILDDETYDWLAVLRGTVTTGGWPIVVTDRLLIEANDLARAMTGIDIDHTGSAGFAGFLRFTRAGISNDETVAVLFTGVRRHAAVVEGGTVHEELSGTRHSVAQRLRAQ